MSNDETNNESQVTGNESQVTEIVDKDEAVDADIIDESDNSNNLKTKLLSANHWLRFVFMVLFAVIACVASYVVGVLVIIQFIFALVTGDSDHRLKDFGYRLSQYIFEILSFLTYNSEEKPFPFSDWPESRADDEIGDEESS